MLIINYVKSNQEWCQGELVEPVVFIETAFDRLLMTSIAKRLILKYYKVSLSLSKAELFIKDQLRQAQLDPKIKLRIVICKENKNFLLVPQADNFYNLMDKNLFINGVIYILRTEKQQFVSFYIIVLFFLLILIQYPNFFNPKI